METFNSLSYVCVFPQTVMRLKIVINVRRMAMQKLQRWL